MILRKPVKQATPELIAAKLLYKAVLCKQEVSVLKPKKTTRRSMSILFGDNLIYKVLKSSRWPVYTAVC